MILEEALDPLVFRAVDADTDKVQLLRLELGDSAFHFSVSTYYDQTGTRRFGYQRVQYRRGYPRPIYIEGATHFTNSFPEVENIFRTWLKTEATKYFEDKAEEEEDRTLQDLWAELDISSISSKESRILNNTPFSQDEQKRIVEKLNKLKEEAENLKLVQGRQIELLHERVEYLGEAAKRLGRKDWLMAATGALIELTFEAGLTSEATKHFLQLAGEAIRWIMSHPPLLLT